jgi:hypothetical protein
MSDAVGVDVKRRVFTGGGRFYYGGLMLGAIGFYSNDIINIFYAEGPGGEEDPDPAQKLRINRPNS